MLRLMSLNVERSGHLGRFVPFVRQFAPDVLCLQELVESDIPAITAGTDFRTVHFAAMARHSDRPGETPFGVGIFSTAEIMETWTTAYAGGGDGVALLDRSSPRNRFLTCRYVLAAARIRLDGFEFTVATTHFPWTENGQPSDFQFAAAEQMLAAVAGRRLVLTGDFNAPRGGPIFNRIACDLTDNIPAAVTTTIDPDLHRAGRLELVVDGLFTSRGYRVSDVALHAGLSDHQAITATIAAG